MLKKQAFISLNGILCFTALGLCSKSSQILACVYIVEMGCLLKMIKWLIALDFISPGHSTNRWQ